MSVDDCIEAIRMAYKMASASGQAAYVTDCPADGKTPGGPAVAPEIFEDDVQIKVTPGGQVLFLCDCCGLGVSPLEHDDPLHLRDRPTV